MDNVRKSVEKTQISLKPQKNIGYFTWRPIYIYDNISLNSSSYEKCFRQKLYRKSKHTFFMFSNFFHENRAVYEIMWKNTVERGRLQMTARRMRTAYWITMGTDTHWEYVKLLAFLRLQWSREHASTLCWCVHCRSLVPNFADSYPLHCITITKRVVHMRAVFKMSTFLVAMLNMWLYVQPFWHHNTASLYRCHDHRSCHGMSRRMQPP